MMSADLSGPDPKALWKDQEQDADPVTLAQIHALVRRNDARAKRTAIALAVALVLIGAVGAEAFAVRHDLTMTILFLGGELTTCYLVYRLMFPPRDPAEPAGAYLRRRLQLRLAHLQGGWVWVLLPLAPCIIWVNFVMYQRHQAPLMTRLYPLIIIVLGIVYTAFRAGRRARQVRAELEELDKLLKR
jgi:hypothetical protein